MAFDFFLDWAAARLLVTRSGFWDCAEVDRYRTALSGELDLAARACGIVDVHINLAAAGVLAPEPAERMRPVAALLRDGPTRRVAWVTASALGRLQVRRVVAEAAKFRMFATDAEALAWFAESEEAIRSVVVSSNPTGGPSPAMDRPSIA